MKRRLHAKRDKYAHEKRCSITFLNKTSRFFDLTDRHIFHDKSFLRSRRFIQDRDFFYGIIWRMVTGSKSAYFSEGISQISVQSYPLMDYLIQNIRNTWYHSLALKTADDHHFEIWSAGYTRRRGIGVLFNNLQTMKYVCDRGVARIFSKGEGSGKLCHT